MSRAASRGASVVATWGHVFVACGHGLSVCYRHNAPERCSRQRKTVTPFAWIHIAGGLVALAAGPAALIAAKGSRVHRRAGLVFATAMLVMTGEALVAALAAGQTVNPLVAAFTFYLVATGWAAVKRPVPGRFER